MGKGGGGSQDLWKILHPWLQESTSNVEEWKRQLHSYKEDNTRLKMNLLESEAGRGNCDYDAAAELRELRANFEVRYSNKSK